MKLLQTTNKNTHSQAPKGFTLIEMLLIVTVIGIIAVSSVAGFLVSSDRIQFHNQASDIKTSLTLSRTIAFNNTDQDIEHSLVISKDGLTTLEENTQTNEKPNIVEELDFTLSGEIQINEIKGYNNSTNTWESLPDRTDVTFNSLINKCNIENSTNNKEYLILQIPVIQQATNTTSKYIYLYRENCLIEMLSEEINN